MLDAVAGALQHGCAGGRWQNWKGCLFPIPMCLAQFILNPSLAVLLQAPRVATFTVGSAVLVAIFGKEVCRLSDLTSNSSVPCSWVQMQCDTPSSKCGHVLSGRP